MGCSECRRLEEQYCILERSFQFKSGELRQPGIAQQSGEYRALYDSARTAQRLADTAHANLHAHRLTHIATTKIQSANA
jgi:hypothetical protein